MFIFNRSQAQQLLKLASELPDNNNGRNRGRIYFMVFALLYGLGLRVGEVSMKLFLLFLAEKTGHKVSRLEFSHHTVTASGTEPDNAES